MEPLSFVTAFVGLLYIVARGALFIAPAATGAFYGRVLYSSNKRMRAVGLGLAVLFAAPLIITARQAEIAPDDVAGLLQAFGWLCAGVSVWILLAPGSARRIGEAKSLRASEPVARTLGVLGVGFGLFLIWTAFVVLPAGGPVAAAPDSSLRQRIVDNHLAFLPDGEGPFATVVAIPGCSGIAFDDPAREAEHPDLSEADRLFRGHYPRAAERLRSEGFAVLLVHVHAAEGLLTACAGQLGGDLLADYVDESVAWAKDLDFVDPDRVHVMGWSMGGGAVLNWMSADRPESATVRSAIAVYPACGSVGSLVNPAPLLMLLGGADDIALPEECEALVSRSASQSTVTVYRYPGARHGYDIEGAPSVLETRNGMTVGSQQEATRATWREILSFLSEPG